MPTVTLDPRRALGRFSIHSAGHVGRVAFLTMEMFRALPEWRVWLPRTIQQCHQVGNGSLFIVGLTAAFAGAVVSLQTGYQFTGAIPVYVAGGIIVQSIVLELGPVLTGLLLAGRIGARYAAELGSMRVTEQIDALESLGRSSVSYLLLPRVLAGTLMLPVLTIFASTIGITAGWLLAKDALGMSNAEFIYGARYFFKPFDVWYSLVKALFFGLAISVVPSYVGFTTKGGAEGVGRSTTAAVVSASVLILFLDALLSKILLG